MRLRLCELQIIDLNQIQIMRLLREFRYANCIRSIYNYNIGTCAISFLKYHILTRDQEFVLIESTRSGPWIGSSHFMEISPIPTLHMSSIKGKIVILLMGISISMNVSISRVKKSAWMCLVNCCLIQNMTWGPGDAGDLNSSI